MLLALALCLQEAAWDEGLPQPRRYSIELRGVPIETACRIVAEATGTAILPDAWEADPERRVTVSVRDASFFDLLDALGAQAGGRFELFGLAPVVYLDRGGAAPLSRVNAGPLRFDLLGGDARVRAEPGVLLLAAGDWRFGGVAATEPTGDSGRSSFRAAIPAGLAPVAGDVAVTVATRVDVLDGTDDGGRVEVDLPESAREAWRVWSVTDDAVAEWDRRILFHALRDEATPTPTGLGVPLRGTAERLRVTVVREARTVRVPFEFPRP